MTSLYEVVEAVPSPTPGLYARAAPGVHRVDSSADQPPLLSDLTLASVLTAALETLVPESWSRSAPNGSSATIASAKATTRTSAWSRTTPLASVPWLRELEHQGSNALVLDRRGLTARGGLLPDDHLFKSMARNGLIRDNHVIWAPAHPALPPPAPTPPSASASSASLSTSASTPTFETSPTTSPTTTTAPTVFNVYALSAAVCGHRGVVHGGLSSAMIDETFGYLLYLLATAAAEKTVAGKQQQQGQQEEAAVTWQAAVASVDLKSAMTAHLEVDFVRPLLPDSTVVCVAQIEKIEGRKVWLRAELMSQPPAVAATSQAASGAGSVVYARGRALFVTPRR